MAKKFLSEAYGHDGGAEARSFYDDWAESYDDELGKGGYVTPHRCARALANASKDLVSPVLDLGCGTGLSGAALNEAGFTTIDGWDPSSEMLKRAESRHVYRVLRQIDPEKPLEAKPGAYAAVNAAGVMSPGLAPPSAFDRILGFLPKGGLMAFSLNDHAIEDGAHLAHLRELNDFGQATILFKEYGEHIPGTGLKAWVYVIQKP